MPQFPSEQGGGHNFWPHEDAAGSTELSSEQVACRTQQAVITVGSVCFVCVLLGTERRASGMLGEPSPTELHTALGPSLLSTLDRVL